MDFDLFIDILKREVQPATGCTEPVAVALATANAAAVLRGTVTRADIVVSNNILKNGMRVGIPGTTDVGLRVAAALGFICGDPHAGLQVLHRVGDEDSRLAHTLIAEGAVTLAARGEAFRIEATLTDDRGDVARCVIEECHTNIASLTLNAVPVDLRERDRLAGSGSAASNFAGANLLGILEFAKTVPAAAISFLLDGVEMNLAMAQKGLDADYGIALGRGIADMVAKGAIAADVVNRAKMLTAAACDARMAGANLPVMSSAGSGNHGLTAILPVAVVARHLGKSDEELARALAISHLVTSYIKVYTGRLSPVCGCAVAAGIGASAASAWLYGGSDQQVMGAIQNMIGTLTGMICDGAKGGCALKLATAASEAVLQSMLACRNIIIHNFDGVVDGNIERTIGNLGRICTKGLEGLDEEIIHVMAEADCD